MDIMSLIVEATRNVLRKTIKENLEIETYLNEHNLKETVSKHDIDLEQIFAEAAILASHTSKVRNTRKYRDSIVCFTAIKNEEDLLYVNTSDVKWAFDVDVIWDCVVSANKSIELVHDISSLYEIEFFQILGLRNLSSFVGEIFAKEVRLSMPNRLMSNPNQDGYPDLCALTLEGKQYIELHTRADGTVKTDKHLWSPYPMGGVEVKATCGNTPSASIRPKPVIGESRLSIVTSAEWKAHHQETKNLLGIYWDFIDGLPTILAVFYRNDLDTTIGRDNRDWGAIIQPIEGGGRTTSVSIMKQGRTSREGVKKMGQGWLVLPTDDKLLKPLCSVFSINLEGKLF